MSETTLAAVCILYVFEGRKLSTLPVFLSAVNSFHIRSFDSAIPRSYLFKSTMAGLKHIFAGELQCEQANGLSMAVLASLGRSLSRSSAWSDWCWWCMLVFAFFGLLGISEYADGGLRQCHVVAFVDKVAITIPFSKTCPNQVTIDLVARPDILCPVRAYRLYVQHLGVVRSEANVPFFVSSLSARTAVSAASFTTSFRSRLSAIKVADAAGYSGHSMRRGGFTEMLNAGVPVSVAQAHGRWRSLSYQRYFDIVGSEEARRLATSGLRDRLFDQPSF